MYAYIYIYVESERETRGDKLIGIFKLYIYI